MESELTLGASFETADDIRTDWLISVAINQDGAQVRLPPAVQESAGARIDRSPHTGDGENERVVTNLTTSLLITI